MTQYRRISVSGQTMMAAVCEICPTHPAIWPPSLLESHERRHQVVAGISAGIVEMRQSLSIDIPRPRIRYRGGRSLGSKNRRQMSATGIERKIRARIGR